MESETNASDTGRNTDLEFTAAHASVLEHALTQSDTVHTFSILQSATPTEATVFLTDPDTRDLSMELELFGAELHNLFPVEPTDSLSVDSQDQTLYRTKISFPKEHPRQPVTEIQATYLYQEITTRFREEAPVYCSDCTAHTITEGYPRRDGFALPDDVSMIENGLFYCRGCGRLLVVPWEYVKEHRNESASLHVARISNAVRNGVETQEAFSIRNMESIYKSDWATVTDVVG